MMKNGSDNGNGSENGNGSDNGNGSGNWLSGSTMMRLFGYMMIVLSIVTLLVTYKYVVPTGSIILIISGFILIFWEKWRCMIQKGAMK